VKEKLKKVYGKRLLRIVLYGSFARNNATQESDIDIAVVLEGYVDKGKEIDRVGDTLYDLMIGAGELISVYPVSEEELENSRWPLYRHIRDEGISIWTR
jgi:predicted nucleotidyltransferase